MRRRKSLGSDNNYRSLAESFFSSADQNFRRIRGRHAKSDACDLVEHYTDVVAEATVAEAVSYEAGDDALHARARKLVSTATRAQRGATAACRVGVRARSR